MRTINTKQNGFSSAILLVILVLLGSVVLAGGFVTPKGIFPEGQKKTNLTFIDSVNTSDKAIQFKTPIAVTLTPTPTPTLAPTTPPQLLPPPPVNIPVPTTGNQQPPSNVPTPTSRPGGGEQPTVPFPTSLPQPTNPPLPTNPPPPPTPIAYPAN